MNFIIIAGSPLDGYKYIGPFDDVQSALDFAHDKWKEDIGWWISDIKEPEENTRPKLPPAWRDFNSSDMGLCRILSENMVDKKIIYKDGDSTNYNIDNLELVPIDGPLFEVYETWFLKNSNKEKEDMSDRESFVSSLPGTDYHDIMDKIDEEDIPL